MNKWDERFMQLAETVAGWSSCFQENRHVGAVIVKDKRILTTGYNGASAGIDSCAERGECLRRKRNIASGRRRFRGARRRFLRNRRATLCRIATSVGRRSTWNAVV